MEPKQPDLFANPDEPLGFTVPGEGPDHDGATYEPELDHVRLNAQTLRVWQVVKDGAWRTLAEISAATGDPEASISARLRDLRKVKFGGHTVERARMDGGLHMYRVTPSDVMVTVEPMPEDAECPHCGKLHCEHTSDTF